VKIWKKQVMGQIWSFGRFQGLIWRVPGVLVNWIQNLKQDEGLKCKTNWPWADM
jgi:hypothetical protein